MDINQHGNESGDKKGEKGMAIWWQKQWTDPNNTFYHYCRLLIIQQIVTLSKHGPDSLNICHP